MFFLLFAFLFCRVRLSAIAGPAFRFGVCYYPEQYPSRARWESDFQLMKSLGIDYIRVAEFMWSTYEPSEGVFDWSILDSTFALAEQYNISIILGTPTATPPMWIIQKYGGNTRQSTILPFDHDGRLRTFGSRRHYTFSSTDYLAESQSIVKALAQRYGRSRVLKGWQIDNELGCHSTIKSYGPVDRTGFVEWLSEKYVTIESLNEAYGGAFWSENYNSFSDVDLPNLDVTTPNPALLLDFERYSTDMVLRFVELQAKILRNYQQKPGYPFISTNMMGFDFAFEHWNISQSLDIVGWDAYPIGDITTSSLYQDEEKKFFRTGHPDFIAFNSDLYFGLKKRPYWIFENQAGPSWGTYSPSPAPGMMRLWAYQHFAHGANVVEFYRWRTARQNAEQTHTGLLRVDSSEDEGINEIRTIMKEINVELAPYLHLAENRNKSNVALLVDYQSSWIYEIEPQSPDFSYKDLVFRFYSALRLLGIQVDIVFPQDSWDGYQLVVVPSLAVLGGKVLENLRDAGGKGLKRVVFGPRSGSKEANFAIPPNLAPGRLQEFLGITIDRVETFAVEDFDGFDRIDLFGKTYETAIWKEWIHIHDSDVHLISSYVVDHRPSIVQSPNGLIDYVGFVPTQDFLQTYLVDLLGDVGLANEIVQMPSGFRMCRRGRWYFGFNYSDKEGSIPFPSSRIGEILLGNGPSSIGAHGVTIWTVPKCDKAYSSSPIEMPTFLKYTDSHEKPEGTVLKEDTLGDVPADYRDGLY